MKEVFARRRSAREYVMRSIEMDDREPWERYRQETAEAVGVELDALWRKYAHDWLLKCDDMHYLAEWFYRHVYPSKPGQRLGVCAVTAATAWHVAGNDSRAAEILHRLTTETEARAEEYAIVDEEYSSCVKNIAKAARKLADEFGVRLE